MEKIFEDLPREYDVIIIGTGIVESIIAAACSRIGKSVLQIDTNDYYGSDWTSFPLNGLIQWSEVSKNSKEINIPTNVNERILQTSNPLNIFRNIKIRWNIEINNDESDMSKMTLEKLKKQSRKFTIDLAPKIYYASGSLIDLLVQSNIGRYCEFKLVSRILQEQNGHLENVPNSRADIFNSNSINLIDKRLLMKVIMNCASMSVEDLHEDQDIPFIEYLKKQKLNENLCHLILNSISMVDYDATTKEGFIKAKRFLDSIGRYGNSPFLYQLYGSGEMSQAFCRLCAVFAGIHFLNFPLAGITIDQLTNQCSGIVCTNGERLRAKDAVICNNAFMESISTNRNVIHRMILITDRSIKYSEKEDITYLRLSSPNESGIHVIETSHGSACSPEGIFLLYIFQEKPQENTTENINSIVERLLNLTREDFTRENILGEITFDQVETLSTFSSAISISKFFLTHGPDGSIDHDSAVNTARTLFHQLYSNDQEFLPRAPDPEDIIYDTEDNNTKDTSIIDINTKQESSMINIEEEPVTTNVDEHS